MTSNTRPTGAIARVLDPDVLIREGRTAYVTKYPTANPADLTLTLDQMLIPVERGTGAVVNSEGVGSIFTQDNTVEVTFSTAFSYIALTLSVDAINHACTTTLIDLADGIRTFGARLDANHSHWFRIYDTDHTPTV